MKNPNVTLQIIKTNVQNEESVYTLKGRLLGAATSMEATKIAGNNEVASRIFTKNSKKIEDVATLLDDNLGDENSKTLGHIIIAINNIKKSEKSKFIGVLSKQLFITPPISLVTEIAVDAQDGAVVTMECSDSTLLTLEEIKNDKEN